MDAKYTYPERRYEMDKKKKFPAGLLLFLMIGLVWSFFMSRNTNTPGTPQQGVMANNQADKATAIQYFDQSVTVNGSTFDPQISNVLPAELADGSQWLLAYWWENHEIVNGQGIDWGYFTSVSNNQVIVLAKCHDPTWKNPVPGQTVYTFFAAENLLKYAPDPEGIQRFVPSGGVVNPLSVAVTSTATQFQIPTATQQNQGVLPAVTNTGPEGFPSATPEVNGDKKLGLLEVLRNAGLLALGWIVLVAIVLGIILSRMWKEAHPGRGRKK